VLAAPRYAALAQPAGQIPVRQRDPLPARRQPRTLSLVTRRGKSPGRNQRSGDPRKQPPRRASRSRGSSELDPLISDIDAAMADPHPLGMLSMASGLASTLDPRINRGPDRPEPTGLPSAADFIDVLTQGGLVQTDALAWVLGHLILDDLRRVAALRGIDRKRLLPWMLELGDVEVSGGWYSVDRLRDGGNVALGARVGGFDLSAVAFLDFNNAGAVKDCFVLGAPLSTLQRSWAEIAPAAKVESGELAPADARARIEQGLAAGLLIWPPFESDSWPQAQPLLEWLLRRCPPGGVVEPRPDYTDRQVDRVMQDFFAGPEGQRFAQDSDHAMLLRSWLDFGRTNGFGDPLLASGSKIQIFLLDWVLEHVDAGGAVLAKLPALLAAFLPVGHRQRGISRAGTADVQRTLREITSDFLDEVADLDDGPGLVYLPDGQLDIQALVRRMLADEVGGFEQLELLDADLLPIEELDLEDVPDDLHERLHAIDALISEACRTFFDAEVLTAVRRLTHDIAIGDPKVLRGRVKDATTAAALCWLVARHNDLLGVSGRVQSQTLYGHFGISNASGRARTLRDALVLPARPFSESLGSARYLVGSARAVMIARRDAGSMAASP